METLFKAATQWIAEATSLTRLLSTYFTMDGFE